MYDVYSIVWCIHTMYTTMCHKIIVMFLFYTAAQSVSWLLVLEHCLNTIIVTRVQVGGETALDVSMCVCSDDIHNFQMRFIAYWCQNAFHIMILSVRYSIKLLIVYDGVVHYTDLLKQILTISTVLQL